MQLNNIIEIYKRLTFDWIYKNGIKSFLFWSGFHSSYFHSLKLTILYA